MTGIRVRFFNLYRVILAYLILAAVAALITLILFSVQQIQQLTQPPTEEVYNYAVRLRNGYLIAYAISIGSFSLVSICSIADIIWKRPSSVIKGHNAYASALNLVGLLCAQSFAVPCKYLDSIASSPADYVQ